MSTVAFLGLGRMGQPMALNLGRAGHDLVVYNRSPHRVQPLSAAGARVALTPREAAQQADIIILMLSAPEAVRSVLEGDDGVLNGLREGSTIIDMSTVSPELARWEAEQAGKRHAHALDAPVIGSVKPATEGTLTIVVGGDAVDHERMLPLP